MSPTQSNLTTPIDTYLLLDALAELSVVHEQPSTGSGRAKVAEGSENLKRPTFNLVMFNHRSGLGSGIGLRQVVVVVWRIVSTNLGLNKKTIALHINV